MHIHDTYKYYAALVVCVVIVAKSTSLPAEMKQNIKYFMIPLYLLYIYANKIENFHIRLL